MQMLCPCAALLSQVKLNYLFLLLMLTGASCLNLVAFVELVNLITYYCYMVKEGCEKSVPGLNSTLTT